MILNGKAREDFINWLRKNDGNSDFLRTSKLTITNFLALKYTCQYALIIEWFDSVNILLLQQYTQFGFYNEIKDYNDKSFGEFKTYLIVDYPTRNESNIKAIEKSNEIYNNLKQ